jgi:hypothetical protein
MTTTFDLRTIHPATGPQILPSPHVLLGRRRLGHALGLLWLLDGALQLQSFMFTKGFAHNIIAPAAVGQPSFVAVPVRWNAELIARQPILFNAIFAAVQLAIGLGFLIPRARRPAIVASVLWAAGVWYTGEGLGGLGGGHVSALLGAPGAALLYAVLAVAAWPGAKSAVDGRSERPPYWIVPAWSVLWVGAAILDLLPGNRPASVFTTHLADSASSVPTWLAHFDHGFGYVVQGLGGWTTLLVVAVELAVGLAVFGQRPIRSWAIGIGIVLSIVYWAAGQSFGQLFSGQATDPSTGPLLILLGLAALSVGSRTVNPHNEQPRK